MNASPSPVPAPVMARTLFTSAGGALSATTSSAVNVATPAAAAWKSLMKRTLGMPRVARMSAASSVQSRLVSRTCCACRGPGSASSRQSGAAAACASVMNWRIRSSAVTNAALAYTCSKRCGAPVCGVYATQTSQLLVPPISAAINSIPELYAGVPVAHASVVVDQRGGRGVMAADRNARVQFGQDAARELLPELHPPLVVGVEVPDHALHEDLVLVERDQHAERMRRELLQQDRVARVVAVEHLVRCCLPGLSLRLLQRAAAHQRLGLREEIGDENVMMFLQLGMRLDRDDEVGRNQPRALVQQLVERVLAVDAGGAPDNLSGGIVAPEPTAILRRWPMSTIRRMPGRLVSTSCSTESGSLARSPLRSINSTPTA